MSISLSAAVLLTLSYVDQFQFALTAEEVWQRLIQYPASLQEINSILKALANKHLVRSEGEFWQLNRRLSLAKIRKKRQQYAIKKWLETQQLLKNISWIPWIVGVAITGSVAMDNCQKNDDIDVMVVTKKNRLWLSRFLLIVSIWRLGKRRRHNGNKNNSWCFNLWLDESALSLAPYKRNIYSAYEVCQAKWILDKQNIQKQFFIDNLWVKKLLPNFYVSLAPAQDQIEAQTEEITSSQLKRPLSQLSVMGAVNQILYWLQRSYMYPHMSQEKVDINFAYFHPRPTHRKIFLRWKKSLLKKWSWNEESIAEATIIEGTPTNNHAPTDRAVTVNRQAMAAGHESIVSAKNKDKIVLVTGVFDLFHQEHQNFLQKAKAVGDILVVGIESDVRVKQLKGAGRPLQTQAQRLRQVQQFPAVDVAFVLPDEFEDEASHLALLKKIKPAILAVSSHSPHLDKKRKLIKQVGGELMIVHQHNPRVSTTQLINSAKR